VSAPILELVVLRRVRDLDEVCAVRSGRVNVDLTLLHKEEGERDVLPVRGPAGTEGERAAATGVDGDLR
jgi:hypothetical protein